MLGVHHAESAEEKRRGRLEGHHLESAEFAEGNGPGLERGGAHGCGNAADSSTEGNPVQACARGDSRGALAPG